MKSDPDLSALSDAIARAAEKVEPGITTRVSTRLAPGEYRHGEPPLLLSREIAPPEPFPVEALGPDLGPAAIAMANLVQTPLALAGQSVLLAADLMVVAHADVRLPHGKTVPVILYGAAIGESGDRKSSVDQKANKPIRDHVDRETIVYEVLYQSYQDEKEIYDQLRKIQIKKIRDPSARRAAALDLERLGAPPKPPMKPERTSSEPTMEGLFKYFPDSYPCHGIFSAEGGEFIGGHAMMPDAKTRTAAALNKLFDGDIPDRPRASQDWVKLKGKRLVLHLLVQSGPMETLLGDSDLINQGLLSRILIGAPLSIAGTRFYQDPSREDEAAYAVYLKRMAKLLEVQPQFRPGTNNELQPGIIEMSYEAKTLWVEFYNENERGIKEIDNALVKSVAQKSPEMAARIAAVIALVRGLEPCPEEGNRPFTIPTISATEMRGGITLAKYYRGEIARLAETGASKSIKNALLLLNWFQKHGGRSISMAEINQVGPKRIRSVTEIRSIIKILMSYGWVRKSPGPVNYEGKERGEGYYLRTEPWD